MIEQDEVKIIIGEEALALTPEIVASLFCSLDSDQQARFFNAIVKESDDWALPFDFQMSWVSDSEKLTDSGRRIMSEIGDHSHHGIMRSIMKSVTGFSYAPNPEDIR